MKEWICREMSTSTSGNENGVLMMETELVRCKDCKHNKNDKWVDCPIKEFFGRTLDNYCSLAERKEE